MNFLSRSMGLAWALVVVVGHAQTTRPVESWKPQAGVPYKNFFLPSSISERDARRYANDLHLDVTQQQVFERYFERYQASDEALRRADLPALWTKAREVSAVQGAGIEDLFQARRQFMQAMLAVESELFTGIDAMLGEHQKVALARVQRHRQRAIAQTVRCSMPGANQDLSAILAELNERAEIEPADEAAFSALLESYEASATSLWTEHASARISVILLQRRLLARHDPGAAPAEQERLIEEFTASNRKLTTMGDAIRSLNESSLRNLASVLKPVDSERLLDRFNSSAYPEVYPDPYAADEALACLADTADPGSTLREAIDAVIGDYRRSREATSQRMVDRHLAWRAHVHTNPTKDEAGFEAHKAAMTALQAERALAAREALRQAQALVVDADPCAPILVAYDTRVAAHKPRASGLTSFRP